MRLLFTLVVLHIVTAAKASIGTEDSLRITDSVFSIVLKEEYTHLKLGESIPEVYFYDTLGHKITLDSLFKHGKPVVFITGSYSCPKFRESIPQINAYCKKMGTMSTIVVVYVKEAHPIKYSPYGKTNNNLKENRKKRIRLKPHKFIEERIRQSKKVRADFGLSPIMLMDNENNDFFNKVFSGPNGYLVFSRTRLLEAQKTWFHYTSNSYKDKGKKK
jgi:hypothetical protein